MRAMTAHATRAARLMTAFIEDRRAGHSKQQNFCAGRRATITTDAHFAAIAFRINTPITRPPKRATRYELRLISLLIIVPLLTSVVLFACSQRSRAISSFLPCLEAI